MITIIFPDHLVDTLNSILEYHECTLLKEPDDDLRKLAIKETKELSEMVWHALQHTALDVETEG